MNAVMLVEAIRQRAPEESSAYLAVRRNYKNSCRLLFG